MAKMKITLYHGRIDPTEGMENWGFIGETFLVDDVVMTYMSGLRLFVNDEWIGDIQPFEDMLYYAGAFYGDVEISSCDDCQEGNFDEFDENMAVIPVEDKVLESEDQEIEYGDWVDEYRPILDNFGQPKQFYGQELLWNVSDPKKVWTVVESENDDWFICSGFHIVNAMFYFITEEKHENKNIYMDY
jgi:hypothetical protein